VPDVRGSAHDPFAKHPARDLTAHSPPTTVPPGGEPATAGASPTRAGRSTRRGRSSWMSHRGWVATTMRDRGAASAPIPRAQTWLLASGWGAAWPSPGGSLPFIWWPWPTTGAYAAARVASSASTRVDGKPRVTSFFAADTGRRVGRGRTRQGTDAHPPETSAFQGRGSHQQSTSLPSLVQARTTPVRDGWEVLLAADLGAPPLEGGPCGDPPSLGHRVMAQLPSTQPWRRTKLRPSGIEGWWRCPP
jgi:hypothetical protein